MVHLPYRLIRKDPVLRISACLIEIERERIKDKNENTRILMNVRTKFAFDRNQMGRSQNIFGFHLRNFLIN